MFELLGSGEDAITAALAWTLHSSPTLLAAFVREATGHEVKVNGARLFLQRSEHGRGRTDLEIMIPDGAHLILEAKLGWELPGISQLRLYTQRSSFRASTSPKRIVSLSQADKRFASLHLPSEVDGIPVVHLSRRDIRKLIQNVSVVTRRHEERFILSLLADFLDKTMPKRNVESNRVFVVSLSWDGVSPNWPGTSYVDVVTRYNRYFHPVGGSRGGWPVTPPNYIGFRYDGQLRSIHHIEAATVIFDLAEVAPGILASHRVAKPHFLYELGPAIIPPHKIPAGNRIRRSARAWAALDLLLTSSSLSEAASATKRRIADIL